MCRWLRFLNVTVVITFDAASSPLQDERSTPQAAAKAIQESHANPGKRPAEGPLTHPCTCSIGYKMLNMCSAGTNNQNETLTIACRVEVVDIWSTRARHLPIRCQAASDYLTFGRTASNRRVFDAQVNFMRWKNARHQDRGADLVSSCLASWSLAWWAGVAEAPR